MKLTVGNDINQVIRKINAALLKVKDDYKTPTSVDYYRDKIKSLQETIEKLKKSIETKESTLNSLKKRIENL